MSTLASTISDSTTMVRRQLVHQRRYPSLTVMLIGMPVVFLLLFVYVFGGTLGAGIAGGAGGRAEYLEYVLPGVLLMTVAAVAQGTALSVAMDMTEGIIARFRTMAITRAAVLTGHVVGSLIQTMLGLAVVMAIALAIGFRSTTGPLQWVAAVGVMAMIGFALIWLAVAFGMVTKGVEGASNVLLPLLILPFLGSGFVPTDSMPVGLRWFAEHQPFTPFIETLRGLLMGTPMGNSAVLTVGWCVVIGLAGYLWSLSLYERRSVR